MARAADQQSHVRGGPTAWSLIGGIGEYVVYVALALSTALPFAWVVALSFRTRREFAADPFGLPKSFNLDNYAAVFGRNGVVTFLVNSLLASGFALALLLTCSTLAAYAIARVPFRGRNVLFVLFLLGDAIPLIVIIIPLFVLVRVLGLNDSVWSLVFTYAAMNMGVAVFILRGFFRSISSDLLSAAMLDGCGTLRVIWHVILPIARPALLVVGITNLINFWNEYFIASIVVSKQSSFTLPAGLAATFVNQFETNWPVMAAAVVMMTVPVLVLFVAFQKQIVTGWTYSTR